MLHVHSRLIPSQCRTFAMRLHLVAPSALDELVAQQLLEPLSLARLRELVADALLDLFVTAPAISQRPVTRESVSAMDAPLTQWLGGARWSALYRESRRTHSSMLSPAPGT
jgi:hypothetical protein